MKEGKTKSGIKFTIDERVADDIRLTFLMSEVQKHTDEPLRAMQDIGSLIALLLGSEDSVLVFLNEVANAHNGVCTADAIITEIKEILDTIKSKN